MGDLHMAYQTDRPQRSFSIQERFSNSWYDAVTYGEVPWFILSCIVVIIGLLISLIYLIYYLLFSKKDSSPCPACPPCPSKQTTSPDDSDDKNK